MHKLNVSSIRNDFPILNTLVNNNKLVYFDSAATTQKPLYVLDKMKEYNTLNNGNPHRGAHTLSVKATECYDSVREKVKEFINANSSKEIIFTRNTTEALNLISNSYGMNFINEDDEIVLLISNHHSNIVPWQMIAKAKKARLKYIYTDKNGNISLDKAKKTITNKTKIVSLSHVSNVLGNIYPVKDIIKISHDAGAICIVDGAQSVPHMKIDVLDLDADFYTFSGHKMLGPMGIGVLYGKEDILNKMSPFLTGGDMIEYVEEQDSTFAPLPYKFEAGTQNIEGVVGLGASIDYIEKIGIDNIYNHEKELLSYGLEKLKEIPFINIYGSDEVENRGGVISFNAEGVHSHDVSSILDSYGVSVRSGHHCAQPLMKYLGLNSTCRVSFYIYNTREEIDIFIESLKNVRKWLGYGS